MALRPSPVHFLQGPTLPSSPRDWEQSTPFVTRRVLLLLLFSINSAQIVIDSLLQNEIWKIRTLEAISLAELMISQLTRKQSSLTLGTWPWLTNGDGDCDGADEFCVWPSVKSWLANSRILPSQESGSLIYQSSCVAFQGQVTYHTSTGIQIALLTGEF